MSFAVALPLILGGAQAGLTAAQASSRNAAISRAMGETRASGQRQITQEGRRAAFDRQRNLDNLGKLRGKIRSAAASSGIGFNGSVEAIERQAAFDAALSNAIVDQNARGNLNAIQSGIGARLTTLASDRQNPILAGFVGAMQGAMTGLNIASSLPAEEEAIA